MNTKYLNRQQSNSISFRRVRILRNWLTAGAMVGVLSSASANFTVYNGDLTAESLWRSAVGLTVLEDFETFANGSQIQSLPALRLTFDELAGGGYPQAYLFGGTPYGPMHLGNFPSGINATNRWDDTYVRPTNGLNLHAMGFWNGDGQNATLVAFAYDSSGTLLGSAGAFKGAFGGFISDTPVALVRFEGDTGDGWNHLDGLQVNAVPEPGAASMLFGGMALIFTICRRQAQKVKSTASSASDASQENPCK